MATPELLIQWLSEEMEKRGWGVNELARRANVDPGHLSRILSGERNAGIETYNKFAKAFRVPLETVLAKAGLIPAKEENNDPTVDEINYLLSQLPDNERGIALALIRSLYEHHAQEQERTERSNAPRVARSDAR